MTPGEEAVSYRPSAYYFRKALRETNDPNALRQIGMTLCAALESQKAWARSLGLIPPKDIVLPAEAIDKGWQTEEFYCDHPDQIKFPFDAFEQGSRSS